MNLSSDNDYERTRNNDTADKIHRTRLEKLITTFKNVRFETVEECKKFFVGDVILEDDIWFLTSLNIQVFLSFLQNIGLIPKSVLCPSCGDELKSLSCRSETNFTFRCKKESCGMKRISVFKNTIFENSHVDCRLFFRIIYFFFMQKGE
jgi:hypothetical protein